MKMMRNNFTNTLSQIQIRRMFLVVSVALMFMVTACVSGGYNSQRNNWHRSPASTGHNRCGCLLKPFSLPAKKSYQQPEDAVQA